MHYCCLLFTDKIPSEEEISNKLAPFYEETFYNNDSPDKEYPVFLWDWYSIGGRYKGGIKLKADFDDKENVKKYEWFYLTNSPRNGKLFISSLLTYFEKVAEEKKYSFYDETEWFPSMGIKDGFLYVEGAETNDILNYEDLGCFCYVDSDGTANARSYWDGTKWIDKTDEVFDKELEEVKNKNKGKFVTIIDLHD